VLKLTKKPLNRRIGIDKTGPRNTAACTHNQLDIRLHPTDTRHKLAN